MAMTPEQIEEAAERLADQIEDICLAGCQQIDGVSVPAVHTWDWVPLIVAALTKAQAGEA